MAWRVDKHRYSRQFENNKMFMGSMSIGSRIPVMPAETTAAAAEPTATGFTTPAMLRMGVGDGAPASLAPSKGETRGSSSSYPPQAMLRVVVGEYGRAPSLQLSLGGSDPAGGASSGSFGVGVAPTIPHVGSGPATATADTVVAPRNLSLKPLDLKDTSDSLSNSLSSSPHLTRGALSPKLDQPELKPKSSPGWGGAG